MVKINTELKLKMRLQIQVAVERICTPDDQKAKTGGKKKKKTLPTYICVIEQQDRHVRQMHNFQRGNQTGENGDDLKE